MRFKTYVLEEIKALRKDLLDVTKLVVELKKGKNKCEKCGREKVYGEMNLTIHHDKDKKIILCRGCHDKIHNMDSRMRKVKTFAK